jgi:methanogenic corrinoid protein MtbC1
MSEREPEPELVSIGAVVEHLQHDYPDISHSSLRFLEREGLITPTRTPGGHRLFAPADLQRIRQIKEWQAQRLSLDEIRKRLDEQASISDPADLADRFLTHALAGDVPSAQQVVLTASELGLPIESLFAEVLRPALWELGDRWARREVSVAQEKEVSEAARELIAELTLRAAGPPDSVDGGVVAACVAGERHELGLRMVSGLLRARGVAVHFLGADVALDFLVDAVERRRPRAVLLSATGDKHLPALKQAAEALARLDAGQQLLAGGQAIERHPDLVSSWGIEPLAFDNISAIDTLATNLLNGRR